MPLLNKKTNIFLDSGNPIETSQAVELLEFIDGQTTNPSLFAKNPNVQARLAAGKKFTKEEIYSEYKQIIQDIRKELSEGSISIEVYADEHTSAEEMIKWGREMNTWIDGAHIKLPTIPAGIEAAQQLTMDGINVNMTLVFSEYQAAAVHVATMDTAERPGQVYLSPFVSRLDRVGQNGLMLLDNIQRFYQEQQSHVQILAASVHSAYDIAYLLERDIDIVTIPYPDMSEWVAVGMPASTVDLPAKDVSKLEDIPYQEPEIKGTSHWRDFDIQHDLTYAGLKQFASDWNALLQ